MRVEYLALQKSNMSRLKESLKAITQPVIEELVTKANKLEFVPDVIVGLKILQPVTRREVKVTYF